MSEKTINGRALSTVLSWGAGVELDAAVEAALGNDLTAEGRADIIAALRPHIRKWHNLDDLKETSYTFSYAGKDWPIGTHDHDNLIWLFYMAWFDRGGLVREGIEKAVAAHRKPPRPFSSHGNAMLWLIEEMEKRDFEISIYREKPLTVGEEWGCRLQHRHIAEWGHARKPEVAVCYAAIAALTSDAHETTGETAGREPAK